ncbi:hypothetical protein F0U60_01155 [Archangium minus]|uniref:Uncharacterized protein n=1 Tax=Archangium minus TaxID=83450 RepID=A0ABY9WK97_9BACT|nr:hypothetical protein F0U60_01155 [Archangium minus]
MAISLEALTNGNWDDGRLVTVTPNPSSNSFVCNNIQNSATCLFLYNSANTDHDIVVTVKTSNSAAPVHVTVPGTTSQKGLATLVLINGMVTNAVTLSMGSDQPADSQVQAFLGSVAFPINTSGIKNLQLPENGSVQNFTQFTRFYDVPGSTWYQLTLTSSVYQFYCAQFGPGGSALTIYCLNPGPYAEAQVVQADNNNPVPYKFMRPPSGQPQQKIVQSIFGNAQQWVWINADSITNSQSATIALQGL